MPPPKQMFMKPEGCTLITPADVYSIKEYRQYVQDRSFIDYDGFCQPVIISINPIKMTPVGGLFDPSEIDQMPPETTHVIWYNK